ncbi:unnamed protein product [Rotaria sp. Silwood2]|nr:unnamed protein product [Rotaria sp. Silwood2]CAF2815321.1 unnamed protein product [Rotaria sp. Silwood2]CAF3403673.1 unnamed protein product [Rotaria sp. Silwood2]
MSSAINNANLRSHVTTCQEISYFRSSRRIDIAIEKCYEQLNYIRDSYAKTESKFDIQLLHKSASSSMIDIKDTNFQSLSNNRSCVGRLNAEYYYEYSRVIHLHDQIKECLSIQHIEAIQETLDEWLNAINMLKKSMLTRN